MSTVKSEDLMYLVLTVKKSHPVAVLGSRVDLPLTWFDGMAGVCPVFNDYDKAVEYTKCLGIDAESCIVPVQMR